MKRIIIFASGSGTNAENIIKYFQERKNVEVTHVFSNNLRAKVLKRAHDLKVKALHFDKESFYDSNDVLNILKDAKPDIIVLAGFLWIFPKKIIDVFTNKVINIHPALLPKYGGKGMYGNHVHEAVVRNKEKETGITIHYVNEHYDEGGIIFQAKTPVEEDFCAEDVAKAIHQLEYKHFPVVIEELLFSEEDK
ncbi:formyltetrahydrofolate-dependent phosphoribosylglycinamide formyltransferase [Aquimarina amphilecti]|uniref:Phosphoribosylglycinamide formyltransferase n=1 Tax=Aquimarina amphilecti TaxID=1038014 RepID=A0A1H7K5Z9_AQUAM|nr:phosphoribosylglycinamide formyltransferase [Aquimarina amphilecti]SEK82293.1 formyltetrahydrofolate-dependent phosphoribosylglycinamide formyltransferase [Aquimarina amphilecti]